MEFIVSSGFIAGFITLKSNANMEFIVSSGFIAGSITLKWIKIKTVPRTPIKSYKFIILTNSFRLWIWIPNLSLTLWINNLLMTLIISSFAISNSFQVITLRKSWCQTIKWTKNIKNSNKTQAIQTPIWKATQTKIQRKK